MGLVLAASVSTAAAAPLRVAVIDFTPATADPSLDQLGKGLQSMVTTDLAASPAIVLIERARLREIQDELKLQRRAEVDPRTAVRIGKLAGATHLVSGSFTVLGEKMRIDCRLVAVDSGRVLLAEKVEGEKAAFFELEKSLVLRLVASLGTKLAPKERAQIAKVHTADFEAFRKFSEGIGEFDERRYDEALRALREATRIDAEFKLARFTLAHYEELVAKARASVGAARQAEEEIARLERDKEAQGAAAIVERLYRATQKGSKVERAVALMMLAEVYGDVSDSPFAVLRERGDRFAQRRMSDSFYKAYWASLPDALPGAAPLEHYVEPIRSVETFDRDFAQAVARVRKVARYAPDCHRSTSLALAMKLHLDRAQAADFLARLYELGLDLQPPSTWKQTCQLELARELSDMLDLDRSTAYLLQVQTSTKESAVLAEVTSRLEANRERARLLEGAQRKAELREFLLAGGHFDYPAFANRVDEARAYFVGADLTGDMVHCLESVRGWPLRDEYLLIGAEPVWRLDHGTGSLSTGPRADPWRADEIRFHASSKDAGELLIAGAAPLSRFTIAFTVQYAPPPDWRLPRRNERPTRTEPRPHALRPAVSLLFGLRNIERKGQPLEGYAVRLARDAVRVVKVVAAASSGGERREQTLAEWSTDLVHARRLAVSVTLDGTTLTVEVNGGRFAARAPSDASGFFGFAFDPAPDPRRTPDYNPPDEEEYAAIADLKVLRR